MKRLARAIIVSIACLPASADARSLAQESPATRASQAPAPDGEIVGIVRGRTIRTPLAAIKVVLSAPEATDRVTTTNASGLYRFDALPPAKYNVLVRAGKASFTKIVEVGPHERFRANFSIDPSIDEHREVLIFRSPPKKSSTVRLRPVRGCQRFYRKCARVLRQKARQDDRAARRDARRDGE